MTDDQGERPDILADLKRLHALYSGPGRYVKHIRPIHPADYRALQEAVAAGVITWPEVEASLTYTRWEPYPPDHPDHPDNHPKETP